MIGGYFCQPFRDYIACHVVCGFDRRQRGLLVLVFRMHFFYLEVDIHVKSYFKEGYLFVTQ